eukprot:2481902-Rhodomonas_salina.2
MACGENTPLFKQNVRLPEQNLRYSRATPRDHSTRTGVPASCSASVRQGYAQFAPRSIAEQRGAGTKCRESVGEWS